MLGVSRAVAPVAREGVDGGDLGAEAVYDRTEEVRGLETYVYKIEITDAPIEIVAGVPGTYDDSKEIFVEPVTGSIVDQTDSQVRYDADGKEVLALDLAFTADEVKQGVADAGKNASSLKLLTETVPVIGFAVGVPLALIGTALLILGRRRKEETSPEEV